MKCKPLNSSINTEQILELRGPKNQVDPWKPYAYLVESENNGEGRIEYFATIFLTNRECPFRCLMCDLWKNTTDQRVPTGAIPAQIKTALAQLPSTRNIKLYNSGNFFDSKAIPIGDLPVIAKSVSRFQLVVVENHPRLTNDKCRAFAEMIPGRLQVAMGLETVDQNILARLNKQMTLDDFARAVDLLQSHDIEVRAFILLKPPGHDDANAIEWVLRLEYAFSLGVKICSIIPVRSGNGIMDAMMKEDRFRPPRFDALEGTLQQGLGLQQGIVQLDLWDACNFASCPACVETRIARLREMNLTQKIVAPVSCDDCQENAK